VILRCGRCFCLAQFSCLRLCAGERLKIIIAIEIEIRCTAFAKLQSAYVKCIFRYSQFYSVTMMLSELALPRFEEIVERCRCDFRQQSSRSNSGLDSLFSRLSVW